MMRPLAALVLLAGALTACGGGDTDGGTNTIDSGSAMVRRAPEPWKPVERGPVSFTQGTTIEATSEGVTLDASLGDGARVELELEPGARLSRRNAYAFDLEIGSVYVHTTGMTDRMLIYHGDTYAEAGRVKPGDATFTATVMGGQMAIEVDDGAVQLNAIGATPNELHYVTLPAGEQGVAEKGEQPQKIHADDADAGPYLTPRVSVAVDAGAALSVTVTIAPGEMGAFTGLMSAESAPPNQASIVLTASGEDGEHTIPLLAALLRAGGSLPDTVTATAAEPFVMAFEAPDHGLSPGAFSVRVRYLSYREHHDGPEWIGLATSPAVSVTIPE